MTLPKTYVPQSVEPRLLSDWQKEGIYHYDPDAEAPVYSIDTPPPTVSGQLHLGHVYSYSQADFIARFWRMRGHNVFYPMGYDDNGLPTERLVEQRLGIRAAEVGRRAFIAKCLEVSQEAEAEYEALWRRLGLSIDWRFKYRTVDDLSRQTSQHSFIDLYEKGLIYRQKAPTIWCPECRTAIAQAELDDLERSSELITLTFELEDGGTLPVATTRPELLPACVAVFVHPDDVRYKGLASKLADVPLFGKHVPILEDQRADPEKGTGAVMCCTFGDHTDIQWWQAYSLDLVEAIDRTGLLTEAAGDYAGLSVEEGRKKIIQELERRSLLSNRNPTIQSVRVHERCDSPVEYLITQQWFIRVLDHKDKLLQAGEAIRWHPEHMFARYRAWVEGLSWDWCISRQRYFGVPFPVWYCTECGEIVLADKGQLPVDPNDDTPLTPCSCGATTVTPESDVMDTWATSALTPQIVGRWLEDDAFYRRVFPMGMRPQAHEIIRTRAFYTILKSYYHFRQRPWSDVLISGWGLAGEGMPKVSKSRGGGPMPPLEMIDRYSADAVRYWAASTGPGKDAIISEGKIQAGTKLVTKLWNVARFSHRFLEEYRPPDRVPSMSPADRWILSRTQRLVQRATELYEDYEYAAAKSETETFFWRDLTDNYLEMAKRRLYGEDTPERQGAQYALYRVLLTFLKLFAPLTPYITEEIYQKIYRKTDDLPSIHVAPWPLVDRRLEDDVAEQLGEALVEVATAVRRYKSKLGLKLSFELTRIQLSANEPYVAHDLNEAVEDLLSVTRAGRVEVVERVDPNLEVIRSGETMIVALEP